VRKGRGNGNDSMIKKTLSQEGVREKVKRNGERENETLLSALEPCIGGRMGEERCKVQYDHPKRKEGKKR